MKNFRFLILIFLSGLFIVSCKKDNKDDKEIKQYYRLVKLDRDMAGYNRVFSADFKYNGDRLTGWKEMHYADKSTSTEIQYFGDTLVEFTFSTIDDTTSGCTKARYYFHNDILEKYKELICEDSNLVLTYEENYTYYANGNIEEKIVKQYSSTIKYVYEYNNDLLTFRTKYQQAGSDWFKIGEADYEYDNGNLIATKYYSCSDAGTDKDLIGKEEFTYSDNNNSQPILSQIVAWRVENGVNYKLYWILYEYDENGNLHYEKVGFPNQPGFTNTYFYENTQGNMKLFFDIFIEHGYPQPFFYPKSKTLLNDILLNQYY